MSFEISDGLKKGASAPQRTLKLAYFSESVETIIRSINLDFLQAEIDQSSNVLPPRSLIFLFSMPFDPDRAGINATILIIDLYS